MTRQTRSWSTISLDRHWRDYRKRLRQCRQNPDEDAVHKLRTTTRRLLALMELFRHIAPQAVPRKLRKTVKANLDAFDALRDTQVMRQDISLLIHEHPELIDFLHHIHVEEQRLLMNSRLVLEHIGQQKLRRTLNKTAARCQKSLRQTNTVHRLHSALDLIYQSALERQRHCAPEHPITLHALRISIKKLRYCLEFASPILPDLPPKLLPQIQEHLTRLGDIQNAIVLRKTLERFYGPDFPAPLHLFFDTREQTLIDAHLSHQDAIHTFWRPSADSSFPWVNNC